MAAPALGSRWPSGRPLSSGHRKLGHTGTTTWSTVRTSNQGAKSNATSAAMGQHAPRPENVEGDFFVDHTCIDCDTCRWMAPDVFTRVGHMSAVTSQPQTEETKLRALQATLACPTASIHTRHSKTLIPHAQASFPLPIHDSLPGIFHLGFHSRKSYGATSYFIQNEAGNIMMDCPRFNEPLAKKLEGMGGVKYIVLSHRDDVADHAQWQRRFGASRVIHEHEAHSCPGAELVLCGEGPWGVGGIIRAEMDIVFTPGHTQGCVCLFLKPLGVLFTGDTLAYSARAQSLSIFRSVNWFSLPLQIQSVAALSALDFTWILPGHGRRHQFLDLEDKDRQLEQLLERERQYA